MAAPIQVIPQGLLGLLQLKQQGSNPNDLSPLVTPQVDLFPFWIQRQLQDPLAAGSRTQPTANPGQFQFVPNMIVPQNQAWWVDQYHIFANLLAAETLRFAPGMFAQANSYRLGIDVADNITARARMISCSAGGFWAGPGTTFVVFIFDSLTAGNITIAASVRGVAVPI